MNIRPVIILWIVAMINTSPIRIKLLSMAICLVNFKMIKHHSINKMVFMQNIFALKASLKTPANILKIKAHLGLNSKLPKTTLIKRRSGLILNTLKLSRIVICNRPEINTISKKIQFLWNNY
jgi:hypothetical protein